MPVMMRGGFNLVRKVEEKSSINVNVSLMDAFDDMINTTALRELQRSGGRYTWSNKQNPPIICVLDRVLISNSWEDKFNLASVFTAPRLGSDHNPLIVDTGEGLNLRQHCFKFNSQWLLQRGFYDWVKNKWPVRYKFDILDHWHIISGKLRRAIKGWGQNVDSAQKKLKQDILQQISVLDETSEIRDLLHTEWEERYVLGLNYQQLLKDEELYWQRGGEKWILEGDSNTGYFHKCANGRKRKMQITSLESNGQSIVEPHLLKEHITEYYKQLCDRAEVANMHLDLEM